MASLRDDLLDGELDDEEADWDEDMAFWDIMTGPLSIQKMLNKQRKGPHGGSRLGRSENLNRRRQKGHEDLWSDYFSETPLYDEDKFRRRYRMSSRLFGKILADVYGVDSYFQQMRDAIGKAGFSPHQKLTAALRQLAYGIGGDALDEYCRIGESTGLESLYRFCRAVRELYEAKYLRKPSAEDFKQQLKINQARGFPGMFRSLDCMHWAWKNCPVAWQDQYTDKDKNKSLILEAIADQELWIWHAYFGLAGGNNDINVLDRAFKVLQARFTIVKQPGRSWYESNLVNILMCCIVLHNMIIEDEREESALAYLQVPTLNINRGPMPWLDFLFATAEMNDKNAHFRLRNNIIDHLWARKGIGFANC